jgi:hypothetical protein
MVQKAYLFRTRYLTCMHRQGFRSHPTFALVLISHSLTLEIRGRACTRDCSCTYINVANAGEEQVMPLHTSEKRHFLFEYTCRRMALSAAEQEDADKRLIALLQVIRCSRLTSAYVIADISPGSTGHDFDVCRAKFAVSRCGCWHSALLFCVTF